MPTPFPGMDPYLEQPSIWPDLHNSLIAAIRAALAPRLQPSYYVAIEERTYTILPSDMIFAGWPDLAVIRSSLREAPAAALLPAYDDDTTVAIEVDMPEIVRETYLEVRDVGGEVVTVLELLSPSNKRPGEGCDLYLRKRKSIIGSLTSLVEIDLLRGGVQMPVRGWHGPNDYRLLILQGYRCPAGELKPFSLRRPIPRFRMPLRPNDDEPEVDLNQLLHACYDQAYYNLRINYRAEADPPLGGEDSAWAADLLGTAGLR